MTLEQTEINAVRIFSLQTAIAALIATHPNPRAFAETLEQLIGQSQIEWIQNGVSPDVRQVARDFSQELIDIAKMAAERRENSPGSPGTRT